uniref:Uncharacterized protein n=1 Tax=Anguilla anguilla TaxID=7936 RepID=A0A0E9VUR8_ANGAN
MKGVKQPLNNQIYLPHDSSIS